MCNIEIKTGGRCFVKTVDLKIQELKRLQKDIDEANEGKNAIVIKGWGNVSTELEEEDIFSVNTLIIESNQAKIKQIIEEL